MDIKATGAPSAVNRAVSLECFEICDDSCCVCSSGDTKFCTYCGFLLLLSLRSEAARCSQPIGKWFVYPKPFQKRHLLQNEANPHEVRVAPIPSSEIGLVESLALNSKCQNPLQAAKVVKRWNFSTLRPPLESCEDFEVCLTAQSITCFKVGARLCCSGGSKLDVQRQHRLIRFRVRLGYQY